MGQLPEERITPKVQPFTYTGVDYFGPLYITSGRRREKRWGVLFTCLTIRAVHLEIAHTLDTDSAIMAIRRMCARRGMPKIIFSDNGTNFRGAAEELRKALNELNQEQIKTAMANKGITWKFIPPAAPHMGGCWERLVGSIKVALKSTLNEKAPKEEVLQTLFIEAENIVNSRPLTHVSVDVADPESLTPNHFLIGTSSGITAPGVFNEKDLCLRREWRRSQYLVNHFWNRWIKEYLPTLTKRGKWNKNIDSPLDINDIVVMVDENAPRNTWTIGIIDAVFPGKDGNIRVVDVRSKNQIYRRPVSKICRLDVRDSNGVPSPGEACHRSTEKTTECE